jgi:hypothetical protein
MLDIHGYTKFCNENKARLDRLHLFDRTIATEVQRISAECQSICKRERGDEMLIISASATDCIMAAVSIIDFFACTNSLPGSTINTERHGDIAVLPQFKISAGIAGGQTPLIITETGNLSGPLLNTAARLQMRANELSPKESKIMTTQQVKILVEKEAKRIPSPLLESGALQFYETGQIEFKGVMLVCCEILFKDSEKYKSGFVEESAKLELALKQGLWEHNVFVCLLNLIIKALTTMPPFSIGANNVDGSASAPITNAVLERKCLTSLNAFLHKQNYFKALEALADIIKKIEVIPEFDRLTLDYAHGIYEKYCLVLRPYEEIMNQYIEEKRSEIFNEKDLAIYDTLKKNNGLYEKLRLSARESPKLVQRKAYWNLVIKQHKEKMMMHLYSGKK